MRFNPFLLVACLVQTVLTLAVSLKSSPAEACSPVSHQELYYTFGESLPGDGATSVLLDGAVLLTALGWPVAGSISDNPVSFDSVLSVTVTEVETGQAVPGKLRLWLGADYGATWWPEAPLSPNRHYELVGTLRQNNPRPAEANGPTEIRRSFSTGTQVAPPLELLGELEVSLESFEKDNLHCAPGMCSCEKVGREMGTRARVRVPGIGGGDPLHTYRVELWVSDRTPYQFDKKDQHLEHEVLWGEWGVTTAGEPSETLFEMPRHDTDYTPCFAWRVVDPAGHVREGTPVCLNDTVESQGGLLGCAVGQGPSRSTAFLALLGAMFTVWRSRQRHA